MKLAIIIGVSKYAGSGLSDLLGCEQDAQLIKTIFSSQDEYQDILTITTNTNSDAIKQKLIDFINKYKGKDISEFVFYFTGHGIFLNNEFYYLFSNYKETKIRQTSLENRELDNLIRTISPSLTTKIVDACKSGIPYIKDPGELNIYLKGTQTGFRNCYFMFSSHSDESSYQDQSLSHFTRAVGELVASRTGIIRHKDIIDYVSDSFEKRPDPIQTPFFVVQADFTEQFCIVDTGLQKKIANILSSAKQILPLTAIDITETSNLQERVEAEGRFFCTKEEAIAGLEHLRKLISELKTPPAEADKLYQVELTDLKDYTNIPNILPLGQWLDENKNDYFVEPIKKFERVKEVGNTMTTFYKQLKDEPLNDTDFVWKDKISIGGVKPTIDMPYSCLIMKIAAQYPNINSTVCYIVPFVSRTHVILFTGMGLFVTRGWGEEVLAGEVKWRPFEEGIKDEEGLSKTVTDIMKEFWNFTLTPVKKKFGLLPEPTEAAEAEKKSIGKKDKTDKK
jgi:hypothetical protein